MKTTSQSGSGSQRMRTRFRSCGGVERERHLLLATLQLGQNLLAIHKEKAGEKIETIGKVFPFCFEGVMCVKVREKQLAGAIRNHERPVERIQKARNQLKNLLANCLLIRCY